MRLLETKSLELHEFQGDSIPEYATLSHTWGREEVSYQLLSKPEAKSLAGYGKITSCCNLAAAQGWKYVWIDTCCIDKTSSAELSEAINSMWSWYEKSTMCLVYLGDYRHPANVYEYDPKNVQRVDFARTRWSTRGWTLQELLAPRRVVFYDSSWTEIGDREDLTYDLSAATGISHLHLQHPKKASIAAKMSWMSRRRTTRSEDMAYSLLGLFDVYMPLIYGEGNHAFVRLQQEIVKSSNDESIFAWTDASLLESGMFALSPAAFARSGDVVALQHSGIRRSPYSVTNYGLAIEVERGISSSSSSPWSMPLACTRNHKRTPLTLSLLFSVGNFIRTNVGKLDEMDRPVNPHNDYRLIYIKSSYRHKSAGWSEPPLELRWNRGLEEHLIFDGLISSEPIFEEMKQSGIIYSNYTDKAVKVRFRYGRWQSPWLLHEDSPECPELILQWRLEAGISSISGAVHIRASGSPLENIADHHSSHLLRTGCEITVPLWKDLHLRIDLGRETTGTKSLFIDLKLIVSTRSTIFHKLK